MFIVAEPSKFEFITVDDAHLRENRSNSGSIFFLDELFLCEFFDNSRR
jgi:hypothetical protein